MSDWEIYDSNLCEYGRRLDGRKYEFISIRSPDSRTYTVEANTIDLDSYCMSEIEEYISWYVNSLQDCYHEYGDYAENFIAYCLYDASQKNVIRDGLSWAEANKIIDDYMRR